MVISLSSIVRLFLFSASASAWISHHPPSKYVTPANPSSRATIVRRQEEWQLFHYLDSLSSSTDTDSIAWDYSNINVADSADNALAVVPSPTFPSTLTSKTDTDTSINTTTNTDAASPPSHVFVHVSKDYFGLDRLTPKGPRANADVGEPHDATRSLFEESHLSVGGWWCARGGWPSPKFRDTTEIFTVLEGFGCVTDLDGAPHYFGPGDTVILPKGWSGRWDILQDLHKVWFVHEHAFVVETSDPIRARVIPTSELSAPQNLQWTDAGFGLSVPISPSLHRHHRHHTRSRVIYDLGPTAVGGSLYDAGCYYTLTNLVRQECFYVMEGVFYLANAQNGSAQRCVAGDAIVLPQGWSGHWDVLEPTRTLWVTQK